MPETLAALFFAHVLADFVFQTRWMVENKRNPLVLILHTAIVIATAQAATGQVQAPEILALGAVHLIIDAAKTYLAEDTILAYLADQLAHLATIVVVASVAPGIWAGSFWAGQTALEPSWLLHGMVLGAGAIYAIRAGGFAVGKLMEPLAPAVDPAGLTDGGRLIGLLERGLIFVLMLAGQAASIGFLIAAKSVMRFETASKEQKAAEYVIIGTLASFGWAIVVTLATLSLRDLMPVLEIAPARP